LDITDPNGKYFSSTSVKEFLKAKDEWNTYRELVHLLLNGNHVIDEEKWNIAKEFLRLIFEIDGFPADLDGYLAFQDERLNDDLVNNEDDQQEDALTPLPDNMIRHRDGFYIELSTIHGAKGETHDATLVLETKYHCFDLGIMMRYLTGDLPSPEYPNGDLRPTPSSQAKFKPNQRFIRQFYVAMSRPKHLLCLAVNSNRITPEQKISLIAKGWKILERI